MSLANNIKTIREEKGLMQKEVAFHIGVDKSTYSKIEKGTRELTVAELQKIGDLFHLSMDQLMKFEDQLPIEVSIEDKDSAEQLRLIQQLDEEDRAIVFKIVDKMLTNKRFRDFFHKNIKSL